MDAALWERYVADARITDRYRALVSDKTLPSGCRPWLGALSAKGSGRFWVAEGCVVVAHRFCFALAYGVSALLAGSQIGHSCDEASCQSPEHMSTMSGARNTQDWAKRREIVGNPLRDRRGALGRARALREAALTGLDLATVARQGLPELDLYQDPLPLDPTRYVSS